MDDSNKFPSQISSISAIDIDVTWAYGVGDTAPTTTDVTALENIDLNANVAIDMFLDSDQTNATSTVNANYEVMIWLADFGPATQPIGLDQGARLTQIINGTTLYVPLAVLRPWSHLTRVLFRPHVLSTWMEIS